MSFSKVILCSMVVVLLSSIILSVSAISCYQCNSNVDPKCEELSDHLPHEVAQYYKECNGDYQGKTPFCRKIDVTVMEGKLRRVDRSCGWERSRNPCYKADNDDHLEKVCQCFSDGCNSATSLSVFSSFALVFFGLIAYFY